MNFKISFLKKISDNSYPEVTPVAVIVGILIGVVMTISFSYAALVLGFSTVGSAVAAILGWGILRAIFRRGTIVENNIVQTIASGINATTAGVIFTVPVLLIRGVSFNFWWIAFACVSGSMMGVGFIIPLRKQMIDIERLPFPSGTAVASILKTPSEGIKKARLLIIGAVIASLTYIITQFPGMGLPMIIPETIDFTRLLGMPEYINNTWAISLLGVGIGYLAGRNGLFVFSGGILAYWLITPLVIQLGWLPQGLSSAEQSAFVHDKMTRPLGIGMLVGGSIMGVFLTFPAIKAAFKNMWTARLNNNKSDELPLRILFFLVGAALIVFFLSAYFTSTISVFNALLVALIGALWLWFAGIIVSQATGMTDWTPISGMALLAVVFLLYVLPADQLVTAVLVGATVSVAIAQCADMMQDLKTGHLVGSHPYKQQFLQLLVSWIGPVTALLVMLLIWNSGGEIAETGERLPGFGPGTKIEAPQATALGMTIDSVISGDVPREKFMAGGIIGMLLSFSGISGLGVVIGIAMYLSIRYILPYGLGAMISIYLKRKKGVEWSENNAIPFAAGLIVGEALLTIIFAILKMAGIVQP